MRDLHMRLADSSRLYYVSNIETLSAYTCPWKPDSTTLLSCLPNNASQGKVGKQLSECQGIFEEDYFNSAAVYYTPNPFESDLSVYVGGTDTLITIELYTTQGRLIKTSEHQLSDIQRVINLNTADLQPGGYIIKSCGETTTQSEIIIKR